MTITIEEEIPADLGFDCLIFAKEVISFTLLHEKFPFEAEVNLTLTDNEAIQELNRDYRNIDAATDVLSFPMLNLTEAGKFSSIGQDIENNFNPDSGEAMLGDIVISAPKVKEQAAAFGHSVRREFAFLIVHSILHLLGYDHINPKDAECMEHKQETILNKMNVFRSQEDE